MKDPFDTSTEDFIQPVQRVLLEAKIQTACVKWMRVRGYWARKFSSPANRSVPDYLFSRAKVLVVDGKVDDCWAGMEPGVNKIKFATEFKRGDAPVHRNTGCMSTKNQVEEQDAMRAAGWYVFECNNIEHFKHTVLTFESTVCRAG